MYILVLNSNCFEYFYDVAWIVYTLTYYYIYNLDITSKTLLWDSDMIWLLDSQLYFYVWNNVISEKNKYRQYNFICYCVGNLISTGKIWINSNKIKYFKL